MYGYESRLEMPYKEWADVLHEEKCGGARPEPEPIRVKMGDRYRQWEFGRYVDTLTVTATNIKYITQVVNDPENDITYFEHLDTIKCHIQTGKKTSYWRVFDIEKELPVVGGEYSGAEVIHVEELYPHNENADPIWDYEFFRVDTKDHTYFVATKIDWDAWHRENEDIIDLIRRISKPIGVVKHGKVETII